MTISLPGLIGAVVGAVVGVMDFGMIAALLRRAWERKTTGPIDDRVVARRELVLKVAFVVTLATFVGLGAWFGETIAG